MISSESSLDIITRLIVKEIESGNFNIENILRGLLAEKETTLFQETESLEQKFKVITRREKYNHFYYLFQILKKFIKTYQENVSDKVIIFKENDYTNLLKALIRLLLGRKFCSECFSTNVEHRYDTLFGESLSYNCNDCGHQVRIFRPGKHFPSFILYLNEWQETSSQESKKEQMEDPRLNISEFITYFLRDSFDFFLEKGDLSSIVLFYKILEKNEIVHTIFANLKILKEKLTEHLKVALQNQDFYDFLIGKQFYSQRFGNLRQGIPNLPEIIVQMFIESIRKGNLFNVKYAVENLLDNLKELNQYLEKPKYKGKLEKNFYIGLSNMLKGRQFEGFKELLDLSVSFDIFVDIKNISERFEIISDLFVDSVQRLNLGEVIETLRFACQYQLLERSFSPEELQILQSVRKDKLLLANLEDLFGDTSNSLIWYIYKIMPKDLFNYFISDMSFFSFYNDQEQMVYTVLGYFNQYTIYGLSVQYLGDVRRFLRDFERNLEEYLEEMEDVGKKQEEETSLEYYFKGKQHLVSPTNIKLNKDRIVNKNIYNFYSLSMVLIGGLGPQGQGFTYSTPRGEVVEICSDQKENEAIIIKYKQFLKQQFITKLNKEMQKLEIEGKISQEIIDLLREIINRDDIINYHKKTTILRQIRKFLTEIHPDFKKESSLIETLMNKITEAITVILRPISTIDQFKARMDLIKENKIQSEDIAKLTSLKEKSHYDVLRERFFFQYIVKWFYEIYKQKIPPE